MCETFVAASLNRFYIGSYDSKHIHSLAHCNERCSSGALEPKYKYAFVNSRNFAITLLSKFMRGHKMTHS